MDMSHAMALAAAMDRAGCGLKPGLQFFCAQGPQGIKEIKDSYPDLPLFLDLKFHDIPNTVAAAVRAVMKLAPAYLNVHASGGETMMQAAHEAALEEAHKIGVETPRLLAVTVLTSLDQEALADAGIDSAPSDIAEKQALLAKKARFDGVVCSAHEIEALRQSCGDDFVLMVPGIRPPGADHGDQKRVMTPQQACAAGATHLVLGRPITQAEDPEKAACEILESLSA